MMSSTFFDILPSGAIFFALDEARQSGYAFFRFTHGIAICCDLIPESVQADPLRVNTEARAFLSARERLWIYVPEVRMMGQHPQIILWQMHDEPCEDSEKTGRAIYSQMQAITDAVPVIMSVAGAVFPAWREPDSPRVSLDWQIVNSHISMGEA